MKRMPFWISVLAVLTLGGCEDSTKKSVEQAREHVQHLVQVAAKDVEEVRRGLPEGAKLFETLYEGDASPDDDLKAVREALDANRRKVQDLRVAKSTFFALVGSDGQVLRNDQEQDRMAGKSVFAAFPAVRQAAKDKKYVETHGVMKEAAGVAEPRADGQWVAAAPIVVDGEVKGLYVTGWSWSSYAYRLEFHLRGKIRSELLEAKGPGANEPLVYVFIVVGENVYGAPVSPDVNIDALEKLGLMKKLSGDEVYTQVMDVTGRGFGFAAKRAPMLGDNVAIGVLRSET